MKRRLLFLLIWIIIDACVDRIFIDIPVHYSNEFVIDGVITNEPGPYTVTLSQVIKVSDSYPRGIPVNAKKVFIFDNLGNSEELRSTADGIYQTKPDGIRGEIGMTYHIRVEMLDGTTFESIPDTMGPVGAVDSIYYDFEAAYQAQIQEPITYQYRIFADAHDVSGGDHYIRWKFNGTYVVETLPQYTLCPYPPCGYCPAPCSGYAWVAGADGLVQLEKGYSINPTTKKVEFTGAECTCCRCWVTAPEAKPKVSDRQLSSAGQFTKIEMGTVPINFYTFFEKYRVEIVQMSLSQTAFNFWKSMQAQKEGVGSLFQPVSGVIPTNIFEINNIASAQGIFYASAVTKKHIYLNRNTHFVKIITPLDCNWREGAIGMDCRLAFPGSYSTTQQPADWK